MKLVGRRYLTACLCPALEGRDRATDRRGAAGRRRTGRRGRRGVGRRRSRGSKRSKGWRADHPVRTVTREPRPHHLRHATRETSRQTNATTTAALQISVAVRRLVTGRGARGLNSTRELGLMCRKISNKTVLNDPLMQATLQYIRPYSPNRTNLLLITQPITEKSQRPYSK